MGHGGRLTSLSAGNDLPSLNSVNRATARRTLARMDFKLAISSEELNSIVAESTAAATIINLGAGLLPRLGIPREKTKSSFILRRRAVVVAAGASAGGGPDGQAAHKEDIGNDPADDDTILPDLERIPFHRDFSLVVVNVALNSGYKGGQLIYALPAAAPAGVDRGEKPTAVGGCGSGGLMMHRRSPQSATAAASLVMPRCQPGDATAHDCAMVHAVSGLVSGVRYSLFAVFERRE